jgi:hypothetical protein
MPFKFAADGEAPRRLLDRKNHRRFCRSRVAAVAAEKAGMLSPRQSDRRTIIKIIVMNFSVEIP